eukprot:SAG31_NODE_920_length_10987_cov_4.682757_2_plen_74_part_00
MRLAMAACARALAGRRGARSYALVGWLSAIQSFALALLCIRYNRLSNALSHEPTKFKFSTRSDFDSVGFRRHI